MWPPGPSGGCSSSLEKSTQRPGLRRIRTPVMTSRPPKMSARAASSPGRKRAAPVLGAGVLAAFTAPAGVVVWAGWVPLDGVIWVIVTGSPQSIELLRLAGSLTELKVTPQ